MLKSVVLPILVVLLVLGIIYGGIATPTEAAGVGAFAATLTVVIYRRFTRKVIKDALAATIRITVMAGWLMFGAKLFSHAYAALGASQFVTQTITELGVSPWLVIIFTQLIIIFLGCFMDGLGIMILTLPIFVPLIRSLGFDTIWFGILVTINLEAAYLTPPFGLNLFYMRMLTPKSVTMVDIYKSIVPFTILMIIFLVIIIIFPELTLWLPSQMIK